MISAVIALRALLLVTPAPGGQASATPIDVAALKIGAPATVVELDLGKLKGDLRQIGWAPDGQQLYIQTAEGAAANPRLRHYTVAIGGGAVTTVQEQPDWAKAFWEFKSDRWAPGIGELEIGVQQKFETLKVGTGPAGALDREGTPLGGGNVTNPDTIAKSTDQNQKQFVIRLTLLDETIGEFVNQQPIPGLTFGWGPEKSGAIAFTDGDGRLLLLDRQKHQRAVAGAKNALLPAWSLDGKQLAWVQKSGRRKFTLVYAAIGG